MVKTNYMIAFLNYHYVIIRPHLEKTSIILCMIKIYDYEWYESINVIFKKIDSYVLSCLDEDVPSESYVSHVTHVMI